MCTHATAAKHSLCAAHALLVRPLTTSVKMRTLSSDVSILTRRRSCSISDCTCARDAARFETDFLVLNETQIPNNRFQLNTNKNEQEML